MIETVTGAIAGLRGTIGLVKTAIDARDDRMIKNALEGIGDRIIAVQDACMRLQETNAAILQDKHTLANEKRELENEIAQLRQQTDKLAQYERTRTPLGAVVFVDKATKDSPDGAVYACTACMDEGKISTMQPIYGQEHLVCPTHGAIAFNSEPQHRAVGILLKK